MDRIADESLENAFPENLRNYSDIEKLENVIPGLDKYDLLIIQKTEKLISKPKQNIIRGTGLLELLIKTLSYMPTPTGKEKENDPITLFRGKILEFLAYSIRSNQENQNIALRQLSVLNEMMFSNTTTTESLLFTRAFIHDNKKLLLSESMCRNMIRILSIYENQRSQTIDLKRILIFNILSEFCQYKGNPIKRNQNMIITNLIDQGENKIAKKLNSMKYKTIFANFSNKLDDYEFQEGKERIVTLPLDIKLVLSLINLLNKCNEGDNSYVANISIKTITLESLTKWMKAPLPIPIKIIILKYIRNAYLSEEIELPDIDIIELLGLFKSLSSYLEIIDDMNKIGQEETSDFCIITHESFVQATQQDQAYISLFLDSCKKLYIMAMLRSDNQHIHADSLTFSMSLGTALNTMLLEGMDGALREKTDDLLSLVTENRISAADYNFKYHKTMQYRLTMKTFKSGIQVGDNPQKSNNMYEFKSESTYEVFNFVLKKYTESEYFKKDTDEELNSLIQIILEAEKNPEDMPGTAPLTISSLCSSFISYLTIADSYNSDNQKKCKLNFI